MTRDTAAPASIEHRIGSTGRLAVKVADWDVELVAVPDDEVRVRDAHGGPLPDDIDVERGGNSISIRQPSLLQGLGIVAGRGSGRRLVIDVPVQATVEVQSASGDVTAAGLRGTQSFRTASGDLALDGVGGDLTTETVSGDLVIGIDGAIGLGVKTVSGDVRIGGGRVQRLTLSTTSGDVHLTSELGSGPHAIVSVSGDVILLSDHGLRITAVTVAGDLRSDLPHTSQGGPGRRSLVVGDGATEVQFRSVSGDLRVLDPASARDGTVAQGPSTIDAPAPPEPPLPPVPPEPTATAAERPSDEIDDADEDEAARLEILRALESGEIDVTEATDRLAALDGPTDG